MRLVKIVMDGVGHPELDQMPKLKAEMKKGTWFPNWYSSSNSSLMSFISEQTGLFCSSMHITKMDQRCFGSNYNYILPHTRGTPFAFYGQKVFMELDYGLVGSEDGLFLPQRVVELPARAVYRNNNKLNVNDKIKQYSKGYDVVMVWNALMHHHTHQILHGRHCKDAKEWHDNVFKPMRSEVQDTILDLIGYFRDTEPEATIIVGADHASGVDISPHSGFTRGHGSGIDLIDIHTPMSIINGHFDYNPGGCYSSPDMYPVILRAMGRIPTIRGDWVNEAAPGRIITTSSVYNGQLNRNHLAFWGAQNTTHKCVMDFAGKVKTYKVYGRKQTPVNLEHKVVSVANDIRNRWFTFKRVYEQNKLVKA